MSFHWSDVNASLEIINFIVLWNKYLNGNEFKITDYDAGVQKNFFVPMAYKKRTETQSIVSPITKKENYFRGKNGRILF